MIQFMYEIIYDNQFYISKFTAILYLLLFFYSSACKKKVHALETSLERDLKIDK